MNAGTILLINDKKYIALKCNKNDFYAQEIKTTPKETLDAFEKKPRKYKLEDYASDNNVLKIKYSSTIYKITEDFIISKKEQIINTINNCCLKEIVKRYYTKPSKFGQGFCRTCKKDYFSIKLEQTEWITFSQERKFFKVNKDTYQVEPFIRENIDKNK